MRFLSGRIDRLVLQRYNVLKLYKVYIMTTHCHYQQVVVDPGGNPRTVLALDSFAMDEIRRGLELVAREKTGGTTDAKRNTLLGEFNIAMGQSETELRRLPRNSDEE